MNIYYDREGNPIDVDRWSLLFEDKNYQILRQTKVGRFTVSTVWLGISHNFGDGDPVIFETMIFADNHEELSREFLDEQYRYCTEKQALDHHDVLVAQAALLEGLYDAVQEP